MNLGELSVEHLGLAARDPAALKDWYVKVLGGRVVYESGQVPPTYFVALPGLTIEIYESRFNIVETEENGLAGWRHLALRVDSLETAASELKTRGVVFREASKPASGGGRVLFFRDSEGNLLHLVERVARSTFPPLPQ